FVVVFVMRSSIAKANLARQARVSQQPQCAIDRGLSNRRVPFTHQTVKVFTRHVAFGVQKHFENKIPLRRALETFLLDVLVKDFLLFGHRFSVGKRTLGRRLHCITGVRGQRNKFAPWSALSMQIGSQCSRLTAFCILLSAYCLLPSAYCIMLSSDPMPGWRNGRRYGLKIR